MNKSSIKHQAIIFSPWLPFGMVTVVAVLLFLWEAGTATITRYLSPYTVVNPFIFVLSGTALFFVFICPLWWKKAHSRFKAAGGALQLSVLTSAVTSFALILSARIYPQDYSEAIVACGLLAMYVAFSYLLFNAANNWYFPLQVLLVASGPLARTMFEEFASQRTRVDFPEVSLVSILSALNETISGHGGAVVHGMERWLAFLLLCVTGIFLCLIMKKQENENGEDDSTSRTQTANS